MGLRRITGEPFPTSAKEWTEREFRRYSIWRWTLTIIQILGLVGFVIGSIWLIRWLGVM